jgi:hypothetical protein
LAPIVFGATPVAAVEAVLAPKKPRAPAVRKPVVKKPVADGGDGSSDNSAG